jgi:hypothetical protein
MAKQKKTHMRGAQNFYYFGVPEHVVMIEILPATTQMKFLGCHQW